MAKKLRVIPGDETEISVEEVNRVLEVGRLLLSVLTPDELEELASLCERSASYSLSTDLVSPLVIGNTSVT